RRGARAPLRPSRRRAGTGRAVPSRKRQRRRRACPRRPRPPPARAAGGAGRPAGGRPRRRRVAKAPGHARPTGAARRHRRPRAGAPPASPGRHAPCEGSRGAMTDDRVPGSPAPEPGTFASGPLLTRHAALFTDLYELTMAASYFRERMRGAATFSLFVRTLPATRGFLLAAGLEDVLEYLRTLRFSGESIEYLRSLGRFEPAFLDYLRAARFTGE